MRKWRKLRATYNSFPISADTGLEPAVFLLESAGEACLPEANWDGLTNKGDEPRRPVAGCDWLDGLLVLDLGGGVFLKKKEECDCYLSKSGYQNRQQCSVFWTVESGLFMFVLLKAPSLILWQRKIGESLVLTLGSPHFLYSFGVSKWRFHEQKYSRARRKRLHCRLVSIWLLWNCDHEFHSCLSEFLYSPWSLGK